MLYATICISILKGIFVKALFSAYILNNSNYSLKEISKNYLNFKLIFTLQQRQYIMTIDSCMQHYSVIHKACTVLTPFFFFNNAVILTLIFEIYA